MVFPLLVCHAMAADLRVLSEEGTPLFVYVDGTERGQTPVTVTLPDGIHVVAIKIQPFLAAEQTLTVTAGGKQTGDLRVWWSSERLEVTWPDEVAAAKMAAEDAAARRAADELTARKAAEDAAATVAAQQDAAAAEQETARRAAEEKAMKKAADQEEARRAAEEASERMAAERAARRTAEDEAEAKRKADRAAVLATAAKVDEEEASRKEAENGERERMEAVAKAEAAKAAAAEAEAGQRAEDASIRAALVRQAKEAIASGDCGAARDAADRYFARTEDGLAYRLRGDALRCAADPRSALLAYRQAAARGEHDASLEQLIATLSARLASAAVTVPAVGADPPPSFRLVTGDGTEVEPYENHNGTVRFRDLPVDGPLTLKWGGLGYASAEQVLGPMLAGEVAHVKANVVRVGVAEVVFRQLPRDVSVSVVDAGARIDNAGAGNLPVTAGAVRFEIRAPTGQTTEEVQLRSGESRTVDVSPWVAAQIALSHLPDGSRVVVTSGPSSSTASAIAVPPGTGVPDESVGLRSVEGVILSDLRTGEYELEIANPVLGTQRFPIIAVAGETVGRKVSWEQFPGFEAATARYSHWQGEVRADRGRRAGMIGSAAVTALAVGTAAFFSYRTLVYNQEFQTAASAYSDASAAGDIVMAADLYDAREDARRKRTSMGVATALSGAGAVLGIGVTVFEWGGVRRLRGSTTWDPFAVDAPTGEGTAGAR